MNNMKKKKDRTLKDELLRLVHAQYATADRELTPKRMTEPKQKHYPVVDVTGDGSIVQYCKQ